MKKTHNHNRFTICEDYQCDTCGQCSEELGSDLFVCEAVGCEAATCLEHSGDWCLAPDAYCPDHRLFQANEVLEGNTLNPGITKVVNWLRSNGFHTTDSGDGKTNLAAGMGCAWDVPMVAIAITHDNFFSETDRLQSMLNALGTFPENEWPSPPQVEATYFPGSDTYSLLLTCFDDAMLEKVMNQCC